MAESKKYKLSVRTTLRSYFVQHGKIQLQYIEKVIDRLLEQGQVFVHSGKYDREYTNSVCSQHPFWSCCLRWSGGCNRRGEEYRDKKNYNVLLQFNQTTTGGFNRDIFSCCRNRKVLQVSQIIDFMQKTEEKNQNSDTFQNDITMTQMVQGKSTLFNNTNGTLYMNNNDLTSQEMALLNDIITGKMPPQFAKVVTTKGAITISVKLPYSPITKNDYHWVFPAVDNKSEKLYEKIMNYDELFQKAKKIHQMNKELKLDLSAKQTEIEKLQLQIKSLETKLNKYQEGNEENNENDLSIFD